jgi:hypothetical protein
VTGSLSETELRSAQCEESDCNNGPKKGYSPRLRRFIYLAKEVDRLSYFSIRRTCVTGFNRDGLKIDSVLSREACCGLSRYCKVFFFRPVEQACRAFETGGVTLTDRSWSSIASR